MSLPVARFCEQLEWLEQNAQVVSLEEILGSPTPAARLQVALTFDDGYRTLAGIVAPLLSERKWPATVYLNTGNIEDQCPQPSQPQIGHYPGEEFLLWEEVEDLLRQGWLIGSHGVDHVDLTGVDVLTAARQLTSSRQTIEKRLGMECRHFAYTWGRNDAPVRSLVAANGYAAAVAAHHGPLSVHSDPMALPRIDVRREYNLADFAAVVRGDWDFLGLAQKIRGIHH